MPTREADAGAEAILDKRVLHALGVLLPVRLSPIAFFSGRHPLGRAGDGMRFLRTRPFEPGQDNPRDIDKFSLPGEYLVNEWEAEARASFMIYADVSASMRFAPKAALTNLTVLQLTYSLWRASDQVRTTLISAAHRELIAKRNLKGQLEQTIRSLAGSALAADVDALQLLDEHARGQRSSPDNLLFLVSDFRSTSASTTASDAARWQSVLRELRCDVVPVIISFEIASHLRGSIRLWDPERQQHRLTLLTRSRVAAINDAERERVAGLQRLFRRLALDHLVLADEHDVYPELARLARWRRRRRA